ncbi:hypothetical protein [Hoeflea poritis]|uniref:ABC transporter permease n=1 Tax=Hoeflea poritis TaxID=2993659 RepID=A0ABT4VP71_9HYPH|nr:hypothetical protein [Hoeflea poritis]MDA4846512.1 hypothetical protein [Hoeflea poritis]
MYRESFVLCKNVMRYFIFALGVQMAAEYFADRGLDGYLVIATTIAPFLSLSLMAYVTYTESLELVGRERTIAFSRVVGFAVRDLGIGVLIFVPFVLAVSIVFAIAGVYGNIDEIYMLSVFVGTVAAAIAYVVCYSLIGTILPAYMARRQLGLAAAFKRGKATFWGTAPLMLAGPAFLSIVSFGLYFSALALSAGEFPTSDTGIEFITAEGRPNIPVCLLFLMYNAITVFTVIMAVWVLSRTYLSSVGEPNLVTVFE